MFGCVLCLLVSVVFLQVLLSVESRGLIPGTRMAELKEGHTNICTPSAVSKQGSRGDGRNGITLMLIPMSCCVTAPEL